MKLKGPENCGGFSHGGESFVPDEAGCIEVEDSGALAAAFAHGYAPAPEQPHPEEEQPPGEKPGDEKPSDKKPGKKA